MPKPIFLEKKKNIIRVSSSELAQMKVKVWLVPFLKCQALFYEKKKKKKKKWKLSFNILSSALITSSVWSGNLCFSVAYSNSNVSQRTFWRARPTKSQISMRICAVWLASSLSAWRNFVSLAIQNAPCEDSDQTARMRSLILIFAGRICPKVRFVPLRLNYQTWQLLFQVTEHSNVRKLMNANLRMIQTFTAK